MNIKPVITHTSGVQAKDGLLQDPCTYCIHLYILLCNGNWTFNKFPRQ